MRHRSGDRDTGRETLRRGATDMAAPRGWRNPQRSERPSPCARRGRRRFCLGIGVYPDATSPGTGGPRMLRDVKNPHQRLDPNTFSVLHRSLQRLNNSTNRQRFPMVISRWIRLSAAALGLVRRVPIACCRAHVDGRRHLARLHHLDIRHGPARIQRLLQRPVRRGDGHHRRLEHRPRQRERLALSVRRHRRPDPPRP